MLGPDNREQWISTYLHVVSGFALFQMPGRETECEAALRRALHGKQELGDVIGMAYALDVLGWLSVKTGSPARTAWLLGAADPLWERGGSVRFSGTAIMEELHQQAARSAARRRSAWRITTVVVRGGHRATCGERLDAQPGRRRAAAGDSLAARWRGAAVRRGGGLRRCARRAAAVRAARCGGAAVRGGASCCYPRGWALAPD